MAQQQKSNNLGNNNVRAIGEVVVSQEGELAKVRDPSLFGSETRGLSSKSTKPKVPKNFNNLPTEARLKALKQYIGSFHYRLNSQTNFNTHKLRPLARIMDTARMIVHAPQPIKCVEAVFIALYLTVDLCDVERVPLGFKTKLYSQVYQHIVLLVQYNDKWGAFGISRCSDLMNKDLIFDSMSSVIENFKTTYESQGHIMLKVRVGLPVEHSIVSSNFVCWRHLNINMKYTSWPECIDAIEKHSTKGKRLWDLWVSSGKSEDPHKSRAIQKTPLDTKVFPFNVKVEDKCKEKKKLARHDTSRIKAKSIAIEPNTICSREASSTSYNIPKISSTKSKSSKTIIVATCPTTIGNSKFRVSKINKNVYKNNSNEGYLEIDRRTKEMKNVPNKIIRNQVLVLKKRFAKTKYFESKFRKEGITSFKLHPKIIFVGPNPLTKRIPICISYQTLNVEALIKRSPTLAKVG